MSDNIVQVSLQRRIQDVRELYGHRNGMFLRGDDRVLFLELGLSILRKLIRRGETDKVVLGKAVGSIFSRTCSFAESFSDLPIIEALCSKYPAGRCAYCLKEQCRCEKKRTAQVQMGEPDPQQLEWSVTQWCQNQDYKYGENNRKNGIEHIIGRLSEEVGEMISSQLVDRNRAGVRLTTIRWEMSCEIADAMAWTFSIAAMLGVIEEFENALDRYAGKCKRCNQRPCDCGPFQHYDVRATDVAYTRAVP